jgi:integrator complex subunit 3
MDIFIKYRPWVDKFPVLIATIVYTYLRVLEDYVGDHFLAIRNKVADFVVGLFRERFSEVLMVGRDLLRVLMYVARIPQIELLWKDMLYRPRVLSPTFKGIIQLMQTR